MQNIMGQDDIKTLRPALQNLNDLLGEFFGRSKDTMPYFFMGISDSLIR